MRRRRAVRNIANFPGEIVPVNVLGVSPYSAIDNSIPRSDPLGRHSRLAGSVMPDELPASRIPLLIIFLALEHRVRGDEHDDCRSDHHADTLSLFFPIHVPFPLSEGAGTPDFGVKTIAYP